MATSSGLDSDSSSVTSDSPSDVSTPSSCSSGGGGISSGRVVEQGYRVGGPAHRAGQTHSYSLGLMDLFAVQLEVTTRLLKAEQKKVTALQREINQQISLDEIDAKKPKEVEQLELNLSRLKQQHDQLEQEYEEAALGLLRKSNNTYYKSSRSQPAIGLTQPNKSRPTIFGTVTKEVVSADTAKRRRSIGQPQVSSLAHMLAMAAATSAPYTNGDAEAVTNGHNGTAADEEEEAEALVYQDGNLIAGSLDALIRHIVPTPTYYPDRTYLFAFLLSSRLFMPPHELMARVCQTCVYQQNLMADDVTKEKLGKFGPHLMQFLSEWTDTFSYDFRDERLMHQLKDMTQRIVVLYPELRKDVGMLMHNLLSKLAGLAKYEDLLNRIHKEVAQRLMNMMTTTDIYEVCPSPLRLAQQLTHIELERFSMIGPEEFVQAFAKEEIQALSKYSDMKSTNNLEAYVQWFNRLSYFVATEICMHLKKRNRVRMIEFFIDVAKECINIGNFNSLMAIIAGLNMNPIQRLKRTWLKVQKEKFEILEHQMNPSNNFGSYRSSLKAALWRAESAGEDRERIVIPFFSLFVKDMYFLNEGCSNKMENGDINFEKFWEMAKQVTDFMTWKQVECPFDRHPPVLNYVLTNPVFTENTLAIASFECEGPENSYEKDRYKSLKEEAGL